MSIVVFQHEASESPARLGSVLIEQGHRLRVIELFEGQVVPVDLDDVDGVISLGGNANVDEVEQHPWLAPEMAYIKAAHTAGRPVVGICLGAQIIAQALGGKVAAMAAPEVGWKTVKLAFPGQTDVVMQGLPWESVQFHLHGQEVVTLPPDGMPLAGSAQCKHQAFRVSAKTYGFQYHFEWDERDLAPMMNNPLVAKAGESPQKLRAEQAQHYASYRRLGDRLCDNLAILLFNAARNVR